MAGTFSGNAYIFLNGSYHKNDRKLVMRLLRHEKPKPLFIAVDGGLTFMQKSGLRPRYWLTDLDSAPRIKKGFLAKTELLLHTPHKDKTDAELAFHFCARNKIERLTFFGWYDTNDETDHLMGNLMLVHLIDGNRKNMKVRFMNSRQEIIHLRDESMIIRARKGCRLSVIPITKKIMLGLRGTRYRARNLAVRQGQTVSLRNYITAQRASVSIKGAALVVLAG
jgi:thiamine pyrophosphokinase